MSAPGARSRSTCPDSWRPRAAGWEPGHGHVSAPGERDGRTHREEWLAGYRGRLGFPTVVLHDTRG